MVRGCFFQCPVPWDGPVFLFGNAGNGRSCVDEKYGVGPSMVPERCGRVSRTSGGVMAKREHTYSSALTNGFLHGGLLNVFVLALVDEGILGSANCQNALPNGFPDGSPLSLAWGVSREISA